MWMTAALESCPVPQRIHINFCVPSNWKKKKNTKNWQLSKAVFYLKSLHIFRISSQTQKGKKIRRQKSKRTKWPLGKTFWNFCSVVFTSNMSASMRPSLVLLQLALIMFMTCSHDTMTNLCIHTYPPVSEVMIMKNKVPDVMKISPSHNQLKMLWAHCQIEFLCWMFFSAP